MTAAALKTLLFFSSFLFSSLLFSSLLFSSLLFSSLLSTRANHAPTTVRARATQHRSRPRPLPLLPPRRHRGKPRLGVEEARAGRPAARRLSLRLLHRLGVDKFDALRGGERDAAGEATHSARGALRAEAGARPAHDRGRGPLARLAFALARASLHLVAHLLRQALRVAHGNAQAAGACTGGWGGWEGGRVRKRVSE